VVVPDDLVAACERRVLSEEERQGAAAGTAGAAAAAAAAPNATLWRERVLTRTLVRCALARYLPWAQIDASGGETATATAPPPVDPASLRFSRNDHGKPHLVLSSSSPPLEFNVTHTPELIGVAVCLAGPVHGGGQGDGREGGVAVALGLDAELAARRAKGAARGRRREEDRGGKNGISSSSSSSSSEEGLTQAEDDDEEADGGASAAATNQDDANNHNNTFRRLAARRFHPLEVQSLEDAANRNSSSPAAAAAARDALFVRLWTLKEAVVKARGVGISHAPGLKGFAVLTAGVEEDKEQEDKNCIASHLRELTGGLGPCEKEGGGQKVSRLSLRWGGSGGTASAAAAPSAALPTDDSFKLLLLQPCPGHVAALCVHALPADGGGAPGSPRGSRGDGPRVAGAVRRVVSREVRASGGGGGGGIDDDAPCVLAGTRWW
jgi:phosphopantetheinyl transferase (holo-ACP synthase)